MNNDLAEGRWPVDGRPVTVADIRVPLFVVGTVRDHVAPWRPVYKIHLLNDSDISFMCSPAAATTRASSASRAAQRATRSPRARQVPATATRPVAGRDASA